MPAGCRATTVAKLHAVRIRDHDGLVASTLDIRQPFQVEVEYRALAGGHSPHRLHPVLQ